jgi:hypothetical protein
MIWLAIVALGNMGVTAWLVRENRRITQMAMSRHTGDFAAMIRAEKPRPAKKKEKEADSPHHSWQNPLEGVAP